MTIDLDDPDPVTHFMTEGETVALCGVESSESDDEFTDCAYDVSCEDCLEQLDLEDEDE